MLGGRRKWRQVSCPVDAFNIHGGGEIFMLQIKQSLQLRPRGCSHGRAAFHVAAVRDWLLI